MLIKRVHISSNSSILETKDIGLLIIWVSRYVIQEIQ
jgi:hypothetical protein